MSQGKKKLGEFEHWWKPPVQRKQAGHEITKAGEVRL
jgi:hypothetical protein